MTTYNIYIEQCGNDFELTALAINDQEDIFMQTHHGFFASHDQAIAAANHLRARYPFYNIID